VIGATAIVLVIGLLYVWTAATSPEGRGLNLLLAEAFQHGETSLPVEPSPELLALDDPYDPEQNAPYRINDASLYKDKWYLYFGPAPTALFFLPLRAVGVDLEDRWAASLLAFAGYACAAALLLVLIGRFVPRTPAAWRLVAVAALGLGNLVLFLLRRPDIYETSIASGLFFLMAAALVLVVGTLRPVPSIPLIALGSLLVGLAAASRANMVFAVALLAWSWWRTRRVAAGWPAIARITAAAFGPLAVCLLGLAVYNAVRFGSPTEFGVNYQLGGINSRELEWFSLDRIPPSLWFLLVQPPHFGVRFPFVTLAPDYPGSLPENYGVEPVAGLLLVAPIILALAAAPFILRRRREPLTREMLVVGGILLGIAVALLLFPVITLLGATERHELDYASLMLIVALPAWLWCANRLRPRRWARATVLGVGAAALLYGSIVNLALGVTGYNDTLRTTHPAIYERLERAFSWVPTLAAKIQGEPVLLDVTSAGSNVEAGMVSPSKGLVRIRGDFLPNPVLPPRSIVAIVVTGSDGAVRRFPLARTDMTVSAGLGGSGFQDVAIRFELVRFGNEAPPPEGAPGAGIGLVNARIVGWSAR
jgi:MFS family permease